MVERWTRRQCEPDSRAVHSASGFCARAASVDEEQLRRVAVRPQRADVRDRKERHAVVHAHEQRGPGRQRDIAAPVVNPTVDVRAAPARASV